TAVDIPEPPGHRDTKASLDLFDSDDSWKITSPSEGSSRQCRLGTNYTMTWSCPEPAVPNRPVRLLFTVRDAQDEPVMLEPYLGMRGHLALRREDGSVFTHLHPGGSASMAAMQLSVLRSEGKAKLDAAFGKNDPYCQLPPMSSG